MRKVEKRILVHRVKGVGFRLENN